MWTCPKCKHLFVTENLRHSCGEYTVEDLLKDKSELAVRLFHYFLDEYKKIGPITLHPVKTRIVFLVKERFSGVDKIGKDFITGGFWLTDTYQHKTFYRVEKISDSCFVHHFKLHHKSDIDNAFRRFMRMAYAIGNREHIKK